MKARPMLAYKVLDSTAPAWFGLPAQKISDADYLRWRACVMAARKLLKVQRGG